MMPSLLFFRIPTSHVTHKETALLFIKPQEQKPEYFEFEFSPAGTVFDAFYTTGRGEPHEIALLWDSGAQVGYRINPSADRRDDNDVGYTIEVAIPLSVFNDLTTAPAKGTSWKFAVCRYDYSKNLPARVFCVPPLES